HLLATRAIDIKNRRPGKPRVLLKETQRLPILPKSSEETRVLFPGEADHAQFRDHDRPTEGRGDGEKRENEFSCDRRVIEREQETAACRYDFRNKHFRVTVISNNAVSEKRKQDSNDEARMTNDEESPKMRERQKATMDV